MEAKIGWIGLGKMGQPMSGHLLKAGYPVYVYSRNDQEKEIMASKGAVIYRSSVALISAVDILFIMVTDDNAIENIFTSEEGILLAELSGKTIVNMSTVSADINRKMAALCAAKGAAYLDAPVSGSIMQAEEAKLVIMAGGEDAVYQKIKPLFDILGSSSSLIGPIGAGNIAKIAVNILLGIEIQGLAEILNFAEVNGVAVEKIMPVINNGVLGSIVMRLKGERIIADDYTPAFALTQIAKDLRLAKSAGADAPLSNAAYKTYQDAENAFGSKDIIAVKKFLQV